MTIILDLSKALKGATDEIDDLRELVRWFARVYCYEDPQTGEIVVQEPIWGFSDWFGNDLEHARRLSATWNSVVKDSGFVAGMGSGPQETPADHQEKG